VTPCVFMPIPVGNVREEKFIDIWRKSRVIQKLRSRDKLWGHCGICSYKRLCGGCRARAWAYFGDLNAPDVGCILNKKHWDECREAPRRIAAQTKPKVELKQLL
ncbi:MAG: SPASM domain-containing protein, partial [Nitrososphaeria archaeon]